MSIAERNPLSILNDAEKRSLEICASEIWECGGSIAYKNIKIGKNLLIAHDLLAKHGSGTFCAWVTENTWLSPQYARQLMQAAEKFGSIAALNRSQITAIIKLSRDDVPAEAVEEAQRRIEAGETITSAEADRMIEASRLESDFPNEQESGLFDEADSDEPDHLASAGKPITEPVPFELHRPFANLPSLPADVSDAFEAFKLCVLRHKLAGWQEITRGDLCATLDALKELAKQPPSE
jgi:hypothetical protein